MKLKYEINLIPHRERKKERKKTLAREKLETAVQENKE